MSEKRIYITSWAKVSITKSTAGLLFGEKFLLGDPDELSVAGEGLPTNE